MSSDSSTAPEQQESLPYFEEGVMAGFPSPVMGELNGTLNLNTLCIRHPATTYYVRARGDSMIGARIYDGDLVFIRKQPDVADGEIAAVLVDDSATLKRVYKDRGAIRLHSENPKYRPMVFTADNCDSIRILGKAVAFQGTIC
jgi:SOS-response transcriptional repressor LexA